MFRFHLPLITTAQPTRIRYFAALFIVFLLCHLVCIAAVIDPTFGTNGEAEVAGDIYFAQTDGRIISVESSADGSGIVVRRYAANGALDQTFGVNGTAATDPTLSRETAKAVAVDSTGRVVIAVETNAYPNLPESILVRFTADGHLDQRFGVNGIAVLHDPVLGNVQALSIQTDGKILFAGNGKYPTYWTMLIGRATPTGALDRTFGRGGVVLSWIEGCGACPPNGNFDSVSANADGSILAGGLAAFTNDSFTLLIAKYNSLGRLEFEHHYQSGYSDHYGTLRFLKELPDGKIVGIGENVLRFLSDGTLDPNFHPNGLLSPGRAYGGHGAILPDGNILHANLIDNPAGLAANSISLVSRDGRPLGNLYTPNAPYPLKAALAQPDGKIIVITDKMRRYTSIGSPAARPGSIGFFHPADGNWNYYNEIFNTTYVFGAAGDIPTPGHYVYTGSGGTSTSVSVGVYRPSDGNWYVAYPNGFAIALTGSAGEVPVGGDFDGDGIDDFTLFQNGHWRMIQSSDGTTKTIEWGIAGDVPIRGDFDHDGIDDLAVFRPSTGTWYVLRSTDGGVQAEQFGLVTDLAVPGDYDGDGSTDLAVFRPSSGTWYIHNSFDGSVRAQAFGIASDRPVPGDYDGDQHTDLAVFRDGTWYIWQSGSNSLKVVQWGQAGDVPLSPGFAAN